MHKVPRNDAERDAAAARVIQTALDGRWIPPFVPGEPSGAAALDTAARVAPELLDAIGGIYGVASWDAATFERVFLRRALAAWKKRVDVQHERESELRVTGPACPLAQEATLDPRVCQACRATQVAAVHAVVGTDAIVSFPRLITHGNAVCEMVISLP